MTTDQQAPDPQAGEKKAAPKHAPTFTAPYVSSDPRPSERRRSGAVLPWLLLVVVAAAGGIGGWSLNQKIDRTQQEIAKHQLTSDNTVVQVQAQAKQAIDTLHDLQSRMTALETRVADSNNQQAALQQLYQDLVRNRDDWVLAETEQIVNSANQQLQLSGNVRGALIALEGADARLSQTGAPQFGGLRDALQQDIEKLKAVPAQDMSSLAGKIDQAIAQIDDLPLQAEEIGAPGAPSGASAAATPAGAPSDWHVWWLRLRNEVTSSLTQLVQVRRLGGSDAMLVSPDQGYFLRANLKLRLLNARLALLGRNQATLHDDLGAAQAALSKYFDGKSRRTQAVLTLLKQVDNDTQSIELPTLDASLAAIAQIKNKH